MSSTLAGMNPYEMKAKLDELDERVCNIIRCDESLKTEIVSAYKAGDRNESQFRGIVAVRKVLVKAYTAIMKEQALIMDYLEGLKEM